MKNKTRNIFSAFVIAIGISLPSLTFAYSPETDSGLIFYVSPKHRESYELNDQGKVISLGNSQKNNNFVVYPNYPMQIVAGALDINSDTDLHTITDYDFPLNANIYMFFETYDAVSLPLDSDATVISVDDLESTTDPRWLMYYGYMSGNPNYKHFRSRAGNPLTTKAYTTIDGSWSGMEHSTSYTFLSNYQGLSTRWLNSTNLLSATVTNKTLTYVSSADVFLLNGTAGNSDFTGELKCLYISTTVFSNETINQLDSECDNYDFYDDQVNTPINYNQYGVYLENEISVGEDEWAYKTAPLKPDNKAPIYTLEDIPLEQGCSEYAVIPASLDKTIGFSGLDIFFQYANYKTYRETPEKPVTMSFKCMNSEVQDQSISSSDGWTIYTSPSFLGVAYNSSLSSNTSLTCLPGESLHILTYSHYCSENTDEEKNQIRIMFNDATADLNRIPIDANTPETIGCPFGFKIFCAGFSVAKNAIVYVYDFFLDTIYAVFQAPLQLLSFYYLEDNETWCFTIQDTEFCNTVNFREQTSALDIILYLAITSSFFYILFNKIL